MAQASSQNKEAPASLRRCDSPPQFLVSKTFELHRGCVAAPFLWLAFDRSAFPATLQCFISVSTRYSCRKKSSRDVQDRLSRHCWRHRALKQQKFGCCTNPRHSTCAGLSRRLRQIHFPLFLEIGVSLDSGAFPFSLRAVDQR